MNWQQVCENPDLQNLPFKIELNEWGQVIMSPTKIKHAAYQGEIAELLKILKKDGIVLTECAIETRKGTKVADVAWVSKHRFEKIKGETTSSIAPEICIEIFSESNIDKEMQEKRKLYFENGAGEAWFCSEEGEIRFYSPAGELSQSELAAAFPKKIAL
jgi:Uma2 family endonuclease